MFVWILIADTEVMKEMNSLITLLVQFIVQILVLSNRFNVTTVFVGL